MKILKMETVQKITCRTCLKRDESIKYEIYYLVSAIKMCASVDIQNNDGLPCGMCNICYEKLINALQFRKLCEKSDRLLRNGSENDIGDESSYPLKNEFQGDLDYQNSDIESSLDGNDNDKHITESEDDIPLKSRKYALELTQRKAGVNVQDTQLALHITDSIEGKINNDVQTTLKPNSRPFLKCKYCHVKFHSPKLRQIHEVKHEEKHVCNECGKEYPTRRQLYSHQHNHKRRQGNHLCPTCGKCFSMPEYLVRHVRTHTGQHPYKCPHCPNRTFNQRNQLKSHLVTHTKEKSFLCNICGNAYARSRSLAVHMRRIHPQPNAKRDYACTVCNKVFIDKRDLSSHSSIHRRAGQFICKVCGKAFNRSSNLRVHEQIHSEHRPHTCPYCPRTFTQKHVLNTHLKTHGEKPMPLQCS